MILSSLFTKSITYPTLYPAPGRLHGASRSSCGKSLHKAALSTILRTALFAGMLLSFAGTALTCTPDGYEPDDSCIQSPIFIAGGETQNHNFCSNAQDWIGFNACHIKCNVRKHYSEAEQQA